MRTVRGVGVGFRREIAEGLLTTSRPVDWVEIVSENFIGQEGRPKELLRRCADRFAIVPHGVTLSPATAPDPAYLAGLSELAARVDAPFVSDHVCFSRSGGQEWFDLLPLPFCAAAARRVAESARTTQEVLGRPLLLENITTYAVMPGSEWDETTFLRKILEDSGAGLLLDVTNLYVNSVNLAFDPRARMEELLAALGPRVRQVHLSGPTHDGQRLIDSHASAVPAVVLELFERVLRACGPVPTLVEWDARIPAVDTVLDEVDRARRVWERFA